MPNVIKTTQYTGVSSKLCIGDSVNLLSVADTYINEARQKANDIVELAEKKSQVIIAEAQKKAEDIEYESRKNYDKAYEDGLSTGTEDGFQQGFDKGYREGTDKAAQDMAELISMFQHAVQTISDAREQVLEEEESRLPALVAEVSEAVLGKMLAEDSKILSDMIKQTISEYRNRDWANIYVSMPVFEQLNSPEIDFIKGIASISPGAKLFVSKEFDETDCVIELENEVIDISMKTQLAKVKAALSK